MAVLVSISVIMNIVFLLAVFKLFVYIRVYRVKYEPTYLPLIFHYIFKYAGREASLEEVKFMRDELHAATAKVENILSDKGCVSLFKTRSARSIGRSC